MINTKDVTIIIPHYGASEEMCYALKQTRDSLHENSPIIKMIVIKNGPYHCDCLYDIRLIDQGQCKSVNAAIATVNTPWIMISNDDMVYGPNWWPKLTDNIFMESCISPILVEPRPGAPTFEVCFCGGAGGDFNRDEFYGYEESRKGHGMRSGFNFPVLMRKELWNTVKGYDINYDPWGSNGDSDLQYKIMLAGIKPKQNTNCAVYHFGQTSGTFHPNNDSYRFKNYEYFKKKWGFMRTDDRIWESDFKIPTKEEGRIYFPEFEGRYK